MNPVRRRVARALTVLATLALAACAVPGQGDPAVAATLGDRVVTNAQVQEYTDAFFELGDAVTSPGVPLTFLLLGPDLISRAEDLGFVLEDSQVANIAQAWMTFDNKEGTATPVALDLVRQSLALYFLLTSDAGFAAVQDLAKAAEQSVVVNPRYGAFSAVQFNTTIGTAGQSAIQKQGSSDQVLFFVEFYQVDAFQGGVPDWISGA